MILGRTIAQNGWFQTHPSWPFSMRWGTEVADASDAQELDLEDLASTGLRCEYSSVCPKVWKVKGKGWRDDSMPESTGCYSRGPRFESQ